MKGVNHVFCEFCPECEGASLLSIDAIEWVCAKCYFAETNPLRVLDNPNQIYDAEEDDE